MQNTWIKPSLPALCAGAAILLAAMAGGQVAYAQGKILRADTDAQGGPGHTMVIVASKIWKRELGVNLQVNHAQTLTRSALKLGAGRLEVMPMPTAVYLFFSNGQRMYRKVKDKAIAASKNTRALLGWLAVVSHPITFANSGIKTLHDLKGKRVFIGPPSGGAAANSTNYIRMVTGMEPKKDYEAIRLPWGSGMQAMLDGKLDVLFQPAGMGASVIEQLGLKQKFRILGVKGDEPGFKKWVSKPWRFAITIPPGTYRSQIDNDKPVITSGGTFQLAVTGKLSDELIYKMTKAIWENLKEMKQTAVTLKSVDPNKPFIGMNMKLHRGAVKYYREKGIAIPARLIPAGAK